MTCLPSLARIAARLRADIAAADHHHARGIGQLVHHRIDISGRAYSMDAGQVMPVARQAPLLTSGGPDQMVVADRRAVGRHGALRVQLR